MKYREFKTTKDSNIWPDFLHFLKTRGYDVEYQEDFWPFVAEHRKTGHKIRIKPTSRAPEQKDLLKLASLDGGDKILVLDFDVKSYNILNLWVSAVGGEGIGILHGVMGWINTPGNVVTEGYKDLAVAMSPRYVRRPDGTFLKRCYKCKQHKPVSEYYLKIRSKRHETDPYRNMCKKCFREGLDKTA